MVLELSAPARRALAKLAGSHGVVPVAGELGGELVRAGYATRIGRGYAITAAGISAAAVQAPTDSAEGASQALPPPLGGPILFSRRQLQQNDENPPSLQVSTPERGSSGERGKPTEIGGIHTEGQQVRCAA